MVNYPNNPTVGQRFTLPSGVVMECAVADATPIWKAVPAVDAKAEEAADRAESAADRAESAESNIISIGLKAEEFALSASTSASQAGASAIAANNSANSSATSAANALASEQAAATSKSNAAASAANALTSEQAAATSKSNAAASAANALASEQAAALSASDASDSKDSAALSAANAQTSEGNASASAVIAVAAKVDAQDARDIALANANFAGAWSNQAGSKSPPYSVRHEPNGESDAIWMLNNPIADIELSEPSASNPDWFVIGVISGSSVTSVNGRTGSVTLTKSDVGLANVDNTSDLAKPISTAAQAALDNKVDKVPGKQLSTEDYTTVEKLKLDGIEEEATANSPDAFLLNRTNHTGTQAASTITGLANVATSGSYNDLSDKPTIPDVPDLQNQINKARVLALAGL